MGASTGRPRRHSKNVRARMMAVADMSVHHGARWRAAASVRGASGTSDGRTSAMRASPMACKRNRGSFSRQRRRSARTFAAEARQALGMGGENIRQYFHGDFTIELRVDGAVDGAHSALAEFRHDAVLRD